MVGVERVGRLGVRLAEVDGGDEMLRYEIVSV